LPPNLAWVEAEAARPTGSPSSTRRMRSRAVRCRRWWRPPPQHTRGLPRWRSWSSGGSDG